MAIDTTMSLGWRKVMFYDNRRQDVSKPDINIAALPNLGPKSAQMLVLAGIHTLGQLRELGAVRAYVQVKRAGNVSLNLLWALEGALSSRHWQEVAKHDRLRLLLALEDAENEYKG